MHFSPKRADPKGSAFLLKMVLSYGKNAKVIEPVELKQMIKAELIEMIEKY